MSDDTESERERIRRQKREELLAERGDDSDAGSHTGTDTGANAPDEPVHVGANRSLETVVADHDTVLVDFYADWCGPCQMLEPAVESVAAETDAAVAKVDIDAHQGLAQQHGVRGVPTLVLYRDGEVAERLVGMQDEATLRELVA
jgi:thioredoxin 1